MKRETLFWLLCGGLGILLILSAFLSNGPTLATSRNCLSPENQTECLEAKMTQDVIRATTDVQTAVAIPTFTPVPTSLTAVADSTPLPLATVEVRQLESQAFMEVVQFRKALSVWQVGAVQSVDPYQGTVIFVISRPGSEEEFSNIGYAFVGGRLSETDHKKYISYWASPRDIGDITITNVTGINGIVSFKTSTGVDGTFDLAKQVWSYN